MRYSDHLVKRLMVSISNTTMEERDFLHSLCSLALRLDSSIIFASIIDHNGKLIVGKSRRWKFKRNNSVKEHFYKFNFNSCLSYCDIDDDKPFSCMEMIDIFSIQTKSIPYSIYFQLVKINEDEMIAFIPITEQKDKYLYVYIYYSNSLSNTLLKLNSIFT